MTALQQIKNFITLIDHSSIELEEFDIILVHTQKEFIAGVIQKCMKILGKNIHKKLVLRRIYNHAEIVVFNPDTKRMCLDLHTAVKKGVVFRDRKIVFSNPKKLICILRYTGNITEKMTQLGRDKAMQLLGKKYDIPSLLFWHVINVFTRFWGGSKEKKAEELIFCYEDAEEIFSAVDNNKKIFDSPHEAVFWDFNEAVKNGFFEIIFED